MIHAASLVAVQVPEAIAPTDTVCAPAVTAAPSRSSRTPPCPACITVTVEVLPPEESSITPQRASPSFCAISMRSGDEFTPEALLSVTHSGTETACHGSDEVTTVYTKL